MENKIMDVKVDGNLKTYSIKFEFGGDKYMISTTLKYKGQFLDLAENEGIIYTFYKCNQNVQENASVLVEFYEKIKELEDFNRPDDQTFWPDNHNNWFSWKLTELCNELSMQCDFEVSGKKFYIVEFDECKCTLIKGIGYEIENDLYGDDLFIYLENGGKVVYKKNNNDKEFTHKNTNTKNCCIISDNQEELDVRIKEFKRSYIEYDKNRIEEFKEHIKQLENL